MDWDDEDEDLPPETPEEIYGNLRRSLQRQTGFELHFVVCDRAKEVELFDRLRREIPEKRFAQLVLDRKDTTLLDKVKELAVTTEFDVLFVRDLDETLLDYEDTKRQAGWSDVQIYSVDWRGVPPILQHLNWARETLHDRFPCAFVICCRPTTIQYLSERAPDFFDWRLGVYRLPLKPSEVDQRILDELSTEDGYKNLTESECIKKLLKLQDLIKITNDTNQLSQLYLQIGKLHLFSQNYNQALVNLQHVLDRDPSNYAVAFLQGIVLSILGRYEDAITSYDYILQRKPDLSIAWFARASILDALEEYEEVISSYDKALQLDPDLHKAWKGRGDALMELERYQDAIASYDKALQLDPDLHEAWKGRGDALMELERYQDAIASYDKALQLKPNDYEACYNQGLAMDYLGQYEEAIPAYQRTIELDPQSTSPYYDLGFLQFEQGDIAGAISTFQKAADFNPSNGIFPGNLGFLCLITDRLDEAETYLLKARELKPSFYMPAFNLAAVRALRSDLDSARSLLAESLQLCPKSDDQEQLHWSIISILLGNVEAGFEQLTATLATLTDPTATWPIRGGVLEASQAIARSPLQTPDLRRAIDLLQSHLTPKPTDP